MLIKRSNKITDYYMTVIILKTGTKVNWYYENEYQLYSAYNQLKKIKIGIKPLYPVIN